DPDSLGSQAAGTCGARHQPADDCADRASEHGERCAATACASGNRRRVSQGTGPRHLRPVHSDGTEGRGQEAGPAEAQGRQAGSAALLLWAVWAADLLWLWAADVRQADARGAAASFRALQLDLVSVLRPARIGQEGLLLG